MIFGIRSIPDGIRGTDITVNEIGSLVRKSLHRPNLRLFTIGVIKRYGIVDKDRYLLATAIFKFIKSNIRFVDDPIGIETVQAPEITLQIGVGDCDDQSALMAAMALAVGIPVRFVVAGYTPDHMIHIFTELFIEGQWMAADTCEKDRIGERIPKLRSEKIYNYRG